MLKRIPRTPRPTLVLAALAALVLGGCSMARPGSTADVPEQGFSAKGTAMQMGRGLTNVGLCWLEIPYEVEARVRGNRGEENYAVFFSVLDVPIGAAWGTVAAVDRCLGGAVEFLWSPLPPYGPVNAPAWPAYFKGEEGVQRNNGVYGSEDDFTTLREDCGIAPWGEEGTGALGRGD